MPQPIIFTLNRTSQTDVAVLQPALRPTRLMQPAFMQLSPRAGVARLPINKPWNVIGLPSLIDAPTTIPSVVHELKPYPPTYFRLTGTTKDSTGAALGNCVVHWFNTAGDLLLDTVTSDANGLFEFRTAGQPPNAYYLVAYKAGSTDVAGTTVNTLTGV